MTTDIEDIVFVPECIRNELEKLAAYRERLLALASIALTAEKVCELHPASRVTVTDYVSQPCIGISCDVESLQDAVPILRTLAQLGWHTDKTRPIEDYPEHNLRVFNLVQDGEVVSQWDHHRLTLRLWLRSDSTACKKVQVGVEEKPVYKFVCE